MSIYLKPFHTESCWEILGIEPTEDEKIIKQAYAKALKQPGIQEDIETFQRLKNAFERARSMAKGKANPPDFFFVQKPKQVEKREKLSHFEKTEILEENTEGVKNKNENPNHFEKTKISEENIEWEKNKNENPNHFEKTKVLEETSEWRKNQPEKSFNDFLTNLKSANTTEPIKELLFFVSRTTLTLEKTSFELIGEAIEYMILNTHLMKREDFQFLLPFTDSHPKHRRLLRLEIVRPRINQFHETHENPEVLESFYKLRFETISNLHIYSCLKLQRKINNWSKKHDFNSTSVATLREMVTYGSYLKNFKPVQKGLAFRQKRILLENPSDQTALIYYLFFSYKAGVIPTIVENKLLLTPELTIEINTDKLKENNCVFEGYYLGFVFYKLGYDRLGKQFSEKENRPTRTEYMLSLLYLNA